MLRRTGPALTAARAVVVALLALALVGCGSLPDYRYKITVYAQGKAYSSVRQIRQREVSSIQDLSGRKVETSLNGQAVIMDLPDGRRVYASLAGKDMPDQARDIAGVALLPSVYKRPDLGNMLDEIAAKQQVIVQTAGPHNLPRTVSYNTPSRHNYPPQETWPLFAEFGDPSDWTTIHTVSPKDIGVSRITIEITTDPVTTGIEETLTKSGDGSRFK